MCSYKHTNLLPQHLNYCKNLLKYKINLYLCYSYFNSLNPYNLANEKVFLFHNNAGYHDDGCKRIGKRNKLVRSKRFL